jgi:glycosyltransferase involved in cell wall biosynthesis
MSSAHILFVNHTSTISGAELVLLDVVQAYRGSSVFLFESGSLESALGQLDIRILKSRFGGGLSSIRRSSRLYNALPFAGRLSAIAAELAVACRRHDVVYANSQKAFVISAVAATCVGRPMIWHLHDTISGAHFGSGQRRLQIALANRFARRVIVPSTWAAKAFVAEGGRSDLVHIVPNGLSIASEQRERPELRRELNLPAGPLIGVFSRLAPWKGQHVVLRALPHLPGVNCILGGDALFGEDAYRDSLIAVVAKLGLGDRVVFLGQRSDVPRLMRAVDIVVHPSVDAEPFGRTLVEAMLVRTPVIATDVGAPAEILNGGAAGTLVAPGDTMQLVAAIRKVLATPNEISRQVAEAQTRAQEVYGVSIMQREIGKVVDAVASRGRS